MAAISRLLDRPPKVDGLSSRSIYDIFVRGPSEVIRDGLYQSKGLRERVCRIGALKHVRGSVDVVISPIFYSFTYMSHRYVINPRKVPASMVL